MKIGIIGLGMIGGSIAKALKRADKKHVIVAYDTDKTASAEALRQKVITYAAEDLSEMNGLDVIYAAVSCNRIVETVKAVSAFSGDAVLTDVASVKYEIATQLSNLNYIGGHPMAGVEKGGFKASKAHMFENAYYVLCGDKNTEAYRRVEALAIQMKAIPIHMDAITHDKTVSRISHLPHMIAYALVNTSLTCEDAKQLAAGGFKDITRIASSSPSLWTEIFKMNRDNVACDVDSFIEQLKMLKAMLVGDRELLLTAYLQQAKDKRDALISTSSGAIARAFELKIDIEDKVGSIGTITSMLAKNKISIANLNIENSREGEAGVFRIAFFDRNAREEAEAVLTAGGIKCLKQ